MLTPAKQDDKVYAGMEIIVPKGLVDPEALRAQFKREGYSSAYQTVQAPKPGARQGEMEEIHKFRVVNVHAPLPEDGFKTAGASMRNSKLVQNYFKSGNRAKAR